MRHLQAGQGAALWWRPGNTAPLGPAHRSSAVAPPKNHEPSLSSSLLSESPGCPPVWSPFLLFTAYRLSREEPLLHSSLLPVISGPGTQWEIQQLRWEAALILWRNRQ